MQNAHNKEPELFDASTYRIGIVVADFNPAITQGLLDAALRQASLFKIPQDAVVIHRVSGSVEIPLVLKYMADSNHFDALVALGAVIRGETDHYQYVAQMVTEGVRQVMLQGEGIPVGFGVLTCETIDQAKQRVHVGADALTASVRSARIVREHYKD